MQITVNAQVIQFRIQKIRGRRKINKENKNTKSKKKRRIRVDVMLQFQDSG